MSTREELRATNDDISELPLIIHDYKFHAKDMIQDVLLVFVTDKDEDEGSIFEKVDSAIKVLKKELTKSGVESVVENYNRLIEPSVTTRLKIALVGEGGVGKTTTLHLLLGDTPPLQYVPTIALNLETVENIRFGNYSLVLWDFAGQERFRTLWRFYFHGADVIFLVCDSTLRNVIISKDILKLIKRDAPKVPVFSLAMKPEVVQKILGIPTYPMVAIDKARRDEMLRILMNAAAQYVGVALPDLPTSDLLKFTDTATEEAIAETDAIAEAKEAEAAAEDEYETVEVVEEVLMDEEGHIIENMEDYEIVEEVIEQVEEDDLFEAEEPEHVEAPIEEEVEIHVAYEEEPSATLTPEVEFSDEDIVHAEISHVETTTLDEVPAIPSIPEEEPSIPEQVDFEISPSLSDEAEDEIGEVHIEIADEEPVGVVTDFEDIFASSDASSGPEVTVEQNNDGVRMAKEIIFEALEADDIISAEIHRASDEEIDQALEAFKSDEVLPAEGEAETEAELDAESLEELESILGPLDRAVGGTGENKENNESEQDEKPLEMDNDSLKELSRLLDFVGSDSEEDEE